MEKIAWGGSKWGREGLFPASPDLAGILGGMDLDFDFFFLHLPGFQNYGFPGSQTSKIWSGLGLGQAGFELEPSGPKHVDFLL